MEKMMKKTELSALGFNDAAAEFKIGMSAKINSLRELTK